MTTQWMDQATYDATIQALTECHGEDLINIISRVITDRAFVTHTRVDNETDRGEFTIEPVAGDNGSVTPARDVILSLAVHDHTETPDVHRQPNTFVSDLAVGDTISSTIKRLGPPAVDLDTASCTMETVTTIDVERRGVITAINTESGLRHRFYEITLDTGPGGKITLKHAPWFEVTLILPRWNEYKLTNPIADSRDEKHVAAYRVWLNETCPA